MITDLDRMLSPEVLAAVDRLDIRVRLLLEGLFQGLHASRRKGNSIEWSGHREYIPGDDPQYIDWLLYARTDRFYVKEYHAETNLRCHLILDATRSMDYSSGPALTKFQYAVALAASFAWYMVGANDRAGLMLLDSDVRLLSTPSSKRRDLVAMMVELSRAEADGKGSIANGIEAAYDRLTRSGFAVVISDLLDDPERTLAAIRLLAARGQDVVVFHVLDPKEIAFDFSQPGVFLDPESGLEVDADPVRAGPAYRSKLRDLRETYRSGLAASRIDYVPVDTSRAFIYPLMEFSELRRRRS